MTDEEVDWEEVERSSAMFGCPPTFKVYAFEITRRDVTRVVTGKAQFPETEADKWRADGWYVIPLGETERLTEDEADAVAGEIMSLTPVQKRVWAKGQNAKRNN